MPENGCNITVDVPTTIWRGFIQKMEKTQRDNFARGGVGEIVSSPRLFFCAFYTQTYVGFFGATLLIIEFMIENCRF